MFGQRNSHTNTFDFAESDHELQRSALMQAAWTVLAAAKDLDDVETQLICRRAIDQLLRREQPGLADRAVIDNYF